MHSTGVEAQGYLRGVQMSNGQGVVTFTNICSGCYLCPGRTII